MKKTDLLIGMLAGLFTAFLGSLLFIVAFIDSDFSVGFGWIKANGHLGKIITLGAILNIVLFFTFLRFHKELMARGVIIATIILAIVTIFIN